MSRCIVRREAADGSLVPPDRRNSQPVHIPIWSTSERAERAPCHGALSDAKRRTVHWCPPTDETANPSTYPYGAPVSERSELHVTVHCPTRSGGRFTGAPRPTRQPTRPHTHMEHQ